ncbi:MAG: hypothetical protein AAB739_00085 [Patescibacteria group bacterium]
MLNSFTGKNAENKVNGEAREGGLGQKAVTVKVHTHFLYRLQT